MWKIWDDSHVCTYVKHRLHCAYFQKFREFSMKLIADLVYRVSTQMHFKICQIRRRGIIHLHH